MGDVINIKLATFTFPGSLSNCEICSQTVWPSHLGFMILACQNSTFKQQEDRLQKQFTFCSVTIICESPTHSESNGNQMNVSSAKNNQQPTKVGDNCYVLKGICN
ncbi:hypothetical protein BsWGS_01625 [Bradybaena similaris]